MISEDFVLKLVKAVSLGLQSARCVMAVYRGSKIITTKDKHGKRSQRFA